MQIGILMTGRPPPELEASLGDYGDFFARLLDGHGFSFRTYAVLDNVFPARPDDADGWLITGSKFGVYEDHAWIEPLKSLIQEIHATGKPLVGICFGHQIMAEALGGKAEKFEGGWSIGAVPYALTDGGTATLHAYHQDQVTTPPPGADTFASTPFCAHAALRYRANTISLQPHPEFDAVFMTDLVEARSGNLPEQVASDALATLGGSVSTDWAVTLIAEALKSGQAPT